MSDLLSAHVQRYDKVPMNVDVDLASGIVLKFKDGHEDVHKFVAAVVDESVQPPLPLPAEPGDTIVVSSAGKFVNSMEIDPSKDLYTQCQSIKPDTLVWLPPKHMLVNKTIHLDKTHIWLRTKGDGIATLIDNDDPGNKNAEPNDRLRNIITMRGDHCGVDTIAVDSPDKYRQKANGVECSGQFNMVKDLVLMGCNTGVSVLDGARNWHVVGLRAPIFRRVDEYAVYAKGEGGIFEGFDLNAPTFAACRWNNVKNLLIQDGICRGDPKEKSTRPGKITGQIGTGIVVRRLRLFDCDISVLPLSSPDGPHGFGGDIKKFQAARTVDVEVSDIELSGEHIGVVVGNRTQNIRVNRIKGVKPQLVDKDGGSVLYEGKSIPLAAPWRVWFDGKQVA